MDLFLDLFKSDVGVLSVLSLLGILGTGGFIFVWVRRKTREEESR